MKSKWLLNYLTIKDIVDEEKKKGQFYLTGSQSIKLMKNISDSLAGRAGVIRMLGLSIRELAGIKYRKPFLPTTSHMEKMDKSVFEFDYTKLITPIHKGFFPVLHESASDLHDWSDYYSSYFQTYIEKVIKDVINIQDEYAFIKFVKAVTRNAIL